MICPECHQELPELAGRCAACGGDPLLGHTWRLLSRVGEGAVGTVWRAVHAQTGAEAALKEMPLRADDDKRLQLIEREARVLRQLDHPGIPRYHGHFLAGRGRSRCLYIAQDFVPGPSLAEEFARHRYTEDEALALALEVLDVLAYLHGLSPPVVHRDVKPSNLVRRADGRLALVDFGAVRDWVGSHGSTLAGTFGYMAPEQFTGHAEPATDIYGLGAVLVFLLSRRDPAELHDRTGHFEWRPHLKVRDETRALLAAMLDPDPARRAGDARELSRRIAGIRSGSSGAELPAPPLLDDPPPGRTLFRQPAPVDLPSVNAPLVRSGARARMMRRHHRRSRELQSILALVVLSLVLAALMVAFWTRPPQTLPAPTPPLPPEHGHRDH